MLPEGLSDIRSKLFGDVRMEMKRQYTELEGINEFCSVYCLVSILTLFQSKFSFYRLNKPLIFISHNATLVKYV